MAGAIEMMGLNGRSLSRRSLVYIAALLIWFPVQLLYELHPQMNWFLLALRLAMSLGMICKYSRDLLWLRRDTMIWLVSLLAVAVLQLLAIVRAGINIKQGIKCAEFLVSVAASFLFFRHLEGKRLTDFRAALLFIACVYCVATLPMAVSNWGNSYQNVVLFVGGRGETVQILFAMSAILLSMDHLLYSKLTMPVVFIFLLGFATAVVLESGQGIMMFGLLLCVLFVSRWRRGLWKCLNLFWGSLIVGVLNFLILTGMYQKVGPVIFLIEKVLKKSVTLTGRTNIYPLLPDIVLDSPVIGFGYASGIVAERIASVNRAYVNAHNSIAELVILFGMAGSVLLLLIVLVTLKRNYRHSEKNCHAVIIGAVWICFVGGLVNIMLSQFVFWWLIAFAFYLCRKTVQIQHGERCE